MLLEEPDGLDPFNPFNTTYAKKYQKYFSFGRQKLNVKIISRLSEIRVQNPLQVDCVRP